MLHTYIKTALLFIAIAFLQSGCQKTKATSEENPQKISKELEEWIRADADERIIALLAKGENLPTLKVSSDCGYAYCTGINYQQGGSSNCTLNITTARNFSVPPFSTLCAAPDNFRYGIVYFGSTGQGAIYGPTGGCLAGSLTYTVNGTSTSSQQPSFVLVYNVYNGPGGGATFVGHVSGNSVNTQCQ